MFWKRLVIVCAFCSCSAGFAFSGECGSAPAKEINLDLSSTRMLSSPHQRWKFISVGPNSSEQRAELYIQSVPEQKKWSVGWIERHGTAFWSIDSQRLFLRDEYAADDTKVRVFDVTGSVPREIKGLDRRIRSAIFARIPQNKTTQWLYYPHVCFAANDSSTIILVADAPLDPKTGSGPGKPFGLKLTVNLITLEIVTTKIVEPPDDPSGKRSDRLGSEMIGSQNTTSS
jgi:hypothetical protein